MGSGGGGVGGEGEVQPQRAHGRRCGRVVRAPETPCSSLRGAAPAAVVGWIFLHEEAFECTIGMLCNFSALGAADSLHTVEQDCSGPVVDVFGSGLLNGEQRATGLSINFTSTSSGKCDQIFYST